jgi:hypothetical protein
MMRTSCDQLLDTMEDEHGINYVRDFLQGIIEHRLANPGDGNMYDIVAGPRLAEANAFIAWKVHCDGQYERSKGT